MKDFKLTDLEKVGPTTETKLNKAGIFSPLDVCLLYTSDAADDSLRVDLGGRRIIK